MIFLKRKKNTHEREGEREREHPGTSQLRVEGRGAKDWNGKKIEGKSKGRRKRNLKAKQTSGANFASV